MALLKYDKTHHEKVCRPTSTSPYNNSYMYIETILTIMRHTEYVVCPSVRLSVCDVQVP